MGRVLQADQQRFQVTVAGGTGSTEFTLTGRIDTVFIKPPSGAPTLNLEIQDEDGDAVAAKANVTTSALIKLDTLCLGKNLFIISSASANGVYIVKLRWEHGV